MKGKGGDMTHGSESLTKKWQFSFDVAEPTFDILEKGIPDEAKREISKTLESLPMVKAEKNALIIKEGKEAYGLYLILHGRVKIMLGKGTKKEQIIDVVGAGDIVGLDTLANDHIFRYSARALTGTKFKILKRVEFESWLHRYPEMMCNVYQELCSTVSGLQDRIFELACCTAEQRVASVLVQQPEALQDKTEDGYVLIDMTRSDIGHMAGISSETASRILSQFAGRGWIRRMKCDIIVLDRQSLAQL